MKESLLDAFERDDKEYRKWNPSSCEGGGI
jgi:hypothetical protein